MNFKKELETLFREYPKADLLLQHCLDWQPDLYKKYQSVLHDLGSSMSLGEESMFEEAKQTYISVYSKFAEGNLNLRFNQLRQKEKELNQQKSLIFDLTTDIEKRQRQLQPHYTHVQKEEQEIEIMKKRLFNYREELKNHG